MVIFVDGSSTIFTTEDHTCNHLPWILGKFFFLFAKKGLFYEKKIEVLLYISDINVITHTIVVIQYEIIKRKKINTQK